MPPGASVGNVYKELAGACQSTLAAVAFGPDPLAARQLRLTAKWIRQVASPFLRRAKGQTLRFSHTAQNVRIP
jgi:hypothetical protein